MSRITKSVQRSPIKSNEQVIGQYERRSGGISKTRDLDYLHFTSNISYCKTQLVTCKLKVKKIIMTQSIPNARTAPHVAVADLGPFAELRQFTFETLELPMKVEGKVFLKQILALSSSETSFNNLPPKTSVPFSHKHRLNEEIYIFVQGKGEFQVDDSMFSVCEGTVVRVDPEGERSMRNTSEVEDLCWIVIQARAGSYPGHTIQDGFGVQKRVSWVGKQSI
jgi:mannose-6-phosphate isomerase-like protein (cupin superfamily)